MKGKKRARPASRQARARSGSIFYSEMHKIRNNKTSPFKRYKRHHPKDDCNLLCITAQTTNFNASPMSRIQSGTYAKVPQGPQHRPIYRLFLHPGYIGLCVPFGKTGQTLGIQFGAWSSQTTAGQFFPFFHSGLVQRIDARYPSRKYRGCLQKHNQPARGVFAAIRGGHMHKRNTALHKRHAGGQSFGFQNIPQTLTGQPAPGSGLRLQHRTAGSRRAEEQASLVQGPSQKHLKQRMLIRHAYGGHGHGSPAVLA